ncbi:hypothetical protein DL240_01615 [Lujinxingia litoralis]|uniref:Sigma-54-dependent Fis family transcriptional regulator n=1 Tax=Lujinxingia litoralis TaxID=2211119 RepID=A0A328CDU9_9DELT|nr:sigma-54 dependent transcriptional regulator [Lujinxingia litoralis]RAL24933.1 hypothetical protein DL240_01615 [Lujinxingia litoralis]
MNELRVLIIDDEESIRHMLSMTLRKEGCSLRAVDNGEDGLKELIANTYDLVLCDVRMPKLGGLELLDELKARNIDATVIMMSAFGSRELAIEALKRGAYDYIDKPFTRDEIVLTLAKAAERLRLRAENRALRARVSRRQGLDRLIGQSDPMQAIFATLERVASFKSTVLITGESGTGKELAARAIHELSPRRPGPFVAINCGAIPEALLESELFGHVRGAFTDATTDHDGLFQAASGGTLFLDEIAELPLALQVKLLRVLQEGEVRRVGDTTSRPVDVRIVAATLHDLKKRVDEGLFREDLYYRIHVIALELPTLRQRPGDIPLLVRHFIEEQNQRQGTAIEGVHDEALEVLTRYSWPGNVRELHNVIERGVVLCAGARLAIDDLPAHLRQAQTPLQQVLAEDELSIKKLSARLERELIIRALKRTEGNRSAAARLLEISHRALLYKLKDYAIEA